MKVQYFAATIFGFIYSAYGFLAQEPQVACQGKCNATESCDLVSPQCDCPGNLKECNTTSLGTDYEKEENTTEKDQCCYCDEDGTHCMFEVEDTEKRGVNANAQLIIVFFDDCESLDLNESTTSPILGLFEEAFYNWTNINTTQRLIIKNNISCTSGEVPNCGVDVAALTSPTTTARRRRSIEDIKIKEEMKLRKDEDEVKSRVRRKIGGGRMRSGTKTKKGSSSDLDLDYSAGYGFVEEVTICGGLALKMTLLPGGAGELTVNETINLLIGLMLNESLTLRFSSDYELLVEMMFYGLDNETLVMRRVPYVEGNDGPRFVPPMDMDFRPFLIASGSFFALFLVVVIYKMIKHTIFLKVNKFTKINSDEIKPNTVNLPPLSKKDIKDESEAVPLPVKEPNFSMSFTGTPVVDNGHLTRNFDWATAIYLPGMLDPVNNNGNTAERRPLALDEDV